MKPIVRWTIGPVSDNGFDCMRRSVDCFLSAYEADAYILHNQLSESQIYKITNIGATLIDQSVYSDSRITPIGVAWKLYPPRLDISKHEIFIDNDLVIESKIDGIDKFLDSDSTLLLEETSRHYGRFERYVPPGYQINSGLFGIPPGFDLEDQISFYCSHWEENCNHSSKTWDEQGLVAFLLLSYKRFNIIPNTVIANCEKEYKQANGMQFVGLNRRQYHRPYIQYKNKNVKLYL